MFLNYQISMLYYIKCYIILNMLSMIRARPFIYLFIAGLRECSVKMRVRKQTNFFNRPIIVTISEYSL